MLPTLAPPTLSPPNISYSISMFPLVATYTKWPPNCSLGSHQLVPFFVPSPCSLILVFPQNDDCLCIVNTTPTVIIHCKCYKNHVLSMTMVIRFELKIFDQIVTSVSFGPKNGNPPQNAETLKTIVCQMAPLAKLPHGGFIYS